VLSDFSDFRSVKGSVLARDGVTGLSLLVGDVDRAPPSIIKLRSRTELGCSDCMRRWAAPFAKFLSGETSGVRFVRWCGTSVLSRAFSASAACADWMAGLVPAREVGATGDCGFIGNGGGARSGSELSHLSLLSLRQSDGIT
jgi:hypothetical protein